MAKAARTFRVIELADGRMQVEYNAGAAPVPGTHSGNVLVYDSREALLSAMADAENQVSDELLVLIALADGWAKIDPSLANPASARGREMQLDLLGAANVVRVVNR